MDDARYVFIICVLFLNMFMLAKPFYSKFSHGSLSKKHMRTVTLRYKSYKDNHVKIKWRALDKESRYG